MSAASNRALPRGRERGGSLGPELCVYRKITGPFAFPCLPKNSASSASPAVDLRQTILKHYFLFLACTFSKFKQKCDVTMVGTKGLIM